jgi:hypothetical protein
VETPAAGNGSEEGSGTAGDPDREVEVTVVPPTAEDGDGTGAPGEAHPDVQVEAEGASDDPPQPSDDPPEDDPRPEVQSSLPGGAHSPGAGSPEDGERKRWRLFKKGDQG